MYGSERGWRGSSAGLLTQMRTEPHFFSWVTHHYTPSKVSPHWVISIIPVISFRALVREPTLVNWILFYP